MLGGNDTPWNPSDPNHWNSKALITSSYLHSFRTVANESRHAFTTPITFRPVFSTPLGLGISGLAYVSG